MSEQLKTRQKIDDGHSRFLLICQKDATEKWSIGDDTFGSCSRRELNRDTK